MLEPILCGLFSEAPLLPKLRGHFAEFLNNASSVGLGILSPSTCVGLRYGRIRSHSGFSRRLLYALRYPFVRSTSRHRPFCMRVFPPCGLLRLYRAFHPPAGTSHTRPRSSVLMRYRNLRLLPIGYAFPPRLRPRLPQGRSALPWNPWIFGRGDSHPPLATHSGILSSRRSTAPHGAASLRRQRSPTAPLKKAAPRASAACFSPGHFRRGASRLVSCYALFQCVAASGPTS